MPLRSALLLTAALALTAQAQAPERHSLRGERVEIWNLAGQARIEAGSGSEVVVEIRRGGRDAERLEVEARDNRLVVRYPDRDIVYRDDERRGNFETRVNVRDDGTFSGDWSDRDSRSTRIRSSGSGLDAHADLVIRVPQGQEVNVNLGAGRIEAVDVAGTLGLRTHVSRISVRGLRGDLTARTGSGGLLAERVTGDVDVSTGSGGVELREVKGSTVRARTGSGGVEGGQVTAERFDVNTGSGGMDIADLAADEIRAGAGSGTIRLDLTKVATSATIRTGSGGVRLTMPGSANVDVDISTGSGGINTDFAVTMEGYRRNSLRGRIGDGGEGSLRISTGSGGVRLMKR